MKGVSGFCACFLILSSGLARGASPVPATHSQAALDAAIDNVVDQLPDVWETDLKDGIILAFPGIDRDRLGRLHLRVDNRSCATIPSLDAQKGEIVIGRGFIMLTVAVQQPQLFFILGLKKYGDAEKISSFYADYLSHVVDELNGICATDNLAAKTHIQIRSAGNYFGVTDRDYGNDEDEVARDADKVKLGNFVGGVAIFLPVLHEAAHYLLRHTSVSSSGSHQEADADAFAAQVLRASHAPTTFSVGPLILLSLAGYDTFADGSSDAREATPCRVKALLARDTDIAGDLAEQGLGRFADGSTQLHEELTKQFADACRRKPARLSLFARICQFLRTFW